MTKDNRHILSASRLNAFYGTVQVLNDTTLSVSSGEMVCLTGPNGSGKTTLMTLMAGIAEDRLILRTSTREDLPAIDGNTIASLGRRITAQHIAYMTQNETSAWNYSVRDIVLTGRYAHSFNGIYTKKDYEVVQATLELLGISYFGDRDVTELSGGEFQKVRIARALAQKPDFLLLDEPVANLDFGYQSELLGTLRSLAHANGPGILISIHDLNTASRFADRIVILPKLEKCISGKPEKVLTPEIVSEAYHMQFGVFEHPAYHCPQVYLIE